MSESEKGGALYRALERIRERFPRVLDNPKAYRLQVLLTDCSENETQSRFQRGGEGGEGGGTRRQGFRCDEEYFYPASTVKLCVAVAALHVLDRLKEDRENDPWAGAANATSLIQALSVNTPLVFKYREDKKGDKGGARACESEEEKEEGRHVHPIVLHEDETNVQGGRAITLGHLIRNVFLVSSNGAFNLLLDFVGRRTLDTFLRVVLGFKHFRIRDYFEDEDFGPKRNWKLLGLEACCGSSRSEDPQDSRVGVRCGDFGFAPLLQRRGTRDRSILHVGRCHPCSSESEQPRPETTVRFERANRGEMEMEAGCLFEDYFVGSSYISDPKDWDLQSGEREVAQPGVQLNTEKKEKIRRAKDFSTKQQASLVELQDFLMLVVRPDLMKKEGGSCSQVLTGESRAFLLDIMAMKTTESDNPKYGSPKYFPSWNKFFLPGIIDAKHMKQKREKESNLAIDPGVRIYNKLGQAYGFSLDNAYVEDTTETGRTAFFLTACLYTNRNGVLNDNCYEYESLGEPFLSQLAEACWLELQSASAV